MKYKYKYKKYKKKYVNLLAGSLIENNHHYINNIKDIVPSLLVDENIDNIVFFGDIDNLRKIKTIEYKLVSSGYIISINRNHFYPLGQCYIEVYLSFNKQNFYQHIQKIKKQSDQGWHKQSQTYLLKGGGDKPMMIIYLVCFYCFYLFLSFSNPIETDIPIMTKSEYLNNFDNRHLSSIISDTVVFKNSLDIPVFSQCGSDGRCTTKNDLEKPPVFATVDLQREDGMSSLGQFYQVAERSLPIMSDYNRGFHRVLKIRMNDDNLIENTPLTKSHFEIIKSANATGEIGFPDNKLLHGLLENVVKEQIIAFKQQNMTNAKEFYVHIFFDQVKPSSIGSVMMGKILHGWHTDGISVGFKRDDRSNIDKLRQSQAARKFDDMPQIPDKEYQTLFSITYGDNPKGVVRTNCRILRKGIENTQLITEDYMGPKRGTILIDQRVYNKEAFVQHQVKNVMDSQPRLIFASIIKEVTDDNIYHPDIDE